MLMRPVARESGLLREMNPGDVLGGGETFPPGKLTTAGAGTWTAAMIASGLITRTGPAGGYTDTTDTAANIIAALAGNFPAADMLPGSTFRLRFMNTVAFAMTLAAGAGVTLGTNGTNVVNCAASLVREYLITVLNATPPVTLTGTFTNANPNVLFVLPPGMLSFPLGQADNPQGITITTGMIITDNTTGGNITAGTTVAGLIYGQGGITGVIMSANGAGNSAAAGDSLTFNSSVRIDGLGTLGL